MDTGASLPPKPVPPMDPWTEAYWQGAREGKLLLQRCGDCGQAVFYPRVACPHCGGEHLDWIQASGRGTVYSYTVVTNNPPSAFMGDLPFVIAIVTLEEGVRMLTNIVGCPPEDVCCEMPVEVTFAPLNGEITLPKFRPARA